MGGAGGEAGRGRQAGMAESISTMGRVKEGEGEAGRGGAGGWGTRGAGEGVVADEEAGPCPWLLQLPRLLLRCATSWMWEGAGQVGGGVEAGAGRRGLSEGGRRQAGGFLGQAEAGRRQGFPTCRSRDRLLPGGRVSPRASCRGRGRLLTPQVLGFYHVQGQGQAVTWG